MITEIKQVKTFGQNGAGLRNFGQNRAKNINDVVYLG